MTDWLEEEYQTPLRLTVPDELRVKMTLTWKMPDGKEYREEREEMAPMAGLIVQNA